MSSRLAIGLAIALLMVASSLTAVMLRPTQQTAASAAKLDLEMLVPRSFGGWRLDDAPVTVIRDPQTEAALDRFYTQVLARTYIGADGQRVMLSIAYGSDQSDTMRVHKPEVCYPAQGFQMQFSQPASLRTPWGELPVRQAYMRRGQRAEPLTYWNTVGERAVASGVQFKLEQLRYGLTGRIPDGMLVRVSTLDEDTAAAFARQAVFLNDLLAALSPAARSRLAGVSPELDGPARR